MKVNNNSFSGRGNEGMIALPSAGDARILPVRHQVLLGSALTILLGLSVFLSGSLIVFAAIIGALICFLVSRSPSASIFAFIIINVVLTLHAGWKTGGAPTTLDLLLGILLAAIIGYWILKLKFFDREQISNSIGQLCIVLFASWSVFVTGLALFGDHNSLADALREMLNLSPLLILPLLYYRFVKPDSKLEYGIFISVLLSGIIIVIWNYFRMRSNVIRAIYLYQIGRGNSDEMISALLVMIAASCIMTANRTWIWLTAGAVLLLGILGVVVSFARTLYVLTIVCVAGIILLGNGRERIRGVLRLLLTIATGIAAFIPIYFSSRVIHLLIEGYASRFISTQHLTTDLSLVNRYVEWRYEWHAILQAPILGHGFGTLFRIFNIISHEHYWIGFSHSSYLYILFKTGFVGAILFFGAYVSFLIKGYRILKSVALSPLKLIITRAGVVFLGGLLIFAYTAPVLDSKTDLIWVGLIWGYFLVLERQLGHAGAKLDDPLAEKQSPVHISA